MQAGTLTKSQAGLTNSCYSTTAVVVETLSGSEEINLAYAVLPSAPARMIVIIHDC